MMAEVFLCQTGQLTAASKRELKRAGVVVVEVEDPSRCQFIRSSSVVSGDDMLWAACDALRATYKDHYSDKGSGSKQHREHFAIRLMELVDAARTADKPPAKLTAQPANGEVPAPA